MAILKRHHRNVHELVFKDKKRIKIGMLSDVHWDNPHCDRDLFKRHMDYCCEEEIPIHFNGDTFCLMQGKGDPRRSKDDIRPEHNTSTYLDSIVEDAIEQFSPWAHNITVMGYGNHETSIIKHQETDILERFVQGLNTKNGTNVQVGGYGGWMVVRSDNKSSRATTNVKYYHGAGGGGIVTKGAINLTRALEIQEGFDVFTMGHIHENAARNDVRETLDGTNLRRSVLKPLHLMITGSYKEEYGSGDKGFHVEKGRPPKPLGGRILDISHRRDRAKGKNATVKTIRSYEFAA